MSAIVTIPILFKGKTIEKQKANSKKKKAKPFNGKQQKEKRKGQNHFGQNY